MIVWLLSEMNKHTKNFYSNQAIDLVSPTYTLGYFLHSSYFGF